MLISGSYEYEYIIEDETKTSITKKMNIKKSSQNSKHRPHIDSKKIMNIQKKDYDVFQALDMDSIAVLRNKRLQRMAKNVISSSHIIGRLEPEKEDGFSQDVPKYSSKYYSTSAPPIIPPHLQHFMLNKRPIRKISSEHPELLPRPCHTLLNHLYAMPMKDGVMAISSTQRYRKKFVTTILYRPICDPI